MTRRYNAPTERTELRLHVELRRRLIAHARARGRSITQEIEDAIAAHCPEVARETEPDGGSKPEGEG